MDRVAIKNQAKEMIRGNKWYIWKPLVMIFLLSLGVGIIAAVLGYINSTLGAIAAGVWEVFGIVLGYGYVYYLVEFVRGRRLEWTALFDYAKEHWVLALLTAFVTAVIVCIGSILLVIPGIIAGIGLTFVSYVVVDNPNLGVLDAIKKSWELTKGYKGFIFIFFLSFIGWMILAELTLGILMIWLFPYVVVAETLVYENLKKIAK